MQKENLEAALHAANDGGLHPRVVSVTQHVTNTSPTHHAARRQHVTVVSPSNRLSDAAVAPD